MSILLYDTNLMKPIFNRKKQKYLKTKEKAGRNGIQYNITWVWHVNLIIVYFYLNLNFLLSKEYCVEIYYVL